MAKKYEILSCLGLHPAVLVVVAIAEHAVGELLGLIKAINAMSAGVLHKSF